MEQFDRATPAVPLVHDGRLEGGDSTDPMKSDVREWTEDIVQHFLKTSKNGRFRHLVSDFQLIDGIQLFNFTEPQMKSICGVALGSALYDSIHGNRAHDRRAREAIIELEEQLGFYSRATLPPLLQVPSIATVLFVCLFFAGVSLLIFVFEQPLQDFFGITEPAFLHHLERFAILNPFALVGQERTACLDSLSEIGIRAELQIVDIFAKHILNEIRHPRERAVGS